MDSLNDPKRNWFRTRIFSQLAVNFCSQSWLRPVACGFVNIPFKRNQRQLIARDSVTSLSLQTFLQTFTHIRNFYSNWTYIHWHFAITNRRMSISEDPDVVSSGPVWLVGCRGSQVGRENVSAENKLIRVGWGKMNNGWKLTYSGKSDLFKIGSWFSHEWYNINFCTVDRPLKTVMKNPIKVWSFKQLQYFCRTQQQSKMWPLKSERYGPMYNRKLQCS